MRWRPTGIDKIENHHEITSAVIYDNLLENYENFSPSYRSVRRYVSILIEEEGIPAPRKIGQYMEVQETPMGFQTQVDMGQKVWKDAYGSKERSSSKRQKDQA